MNATFRPLAAAMIAAGLAFGAGAAGAQTAPPADRANATSNAERAPKQARVDAKSAEKQAAREQRDAVKAWERTHRASRIIGTEVKNTDGGKVGRVKELVVDPSSGRISHVVVSVGGVLGAGDKLFAVPFDGVRIADGENGVVLKQGIALAQGFDDGRWPAPSDPAWQAGAATSAAGSTSAGATTPAAAPASPTPSSGAATTSASGMTPSGSSAGATAGSVAPEPAPSAQAGANGSVTSGTTRTGVGPSDVTPGSPASSSATVTEPPASASPWSPPAQ